MKQSKMEQGNGEVKNKTEHERKTKVQLIGELAEMRQRIVELEAHAKQIEPVLAEHEQVYPVMDENTREFIAISNQSKHTLAERVKELRCLYGIAAIAEKPGITLDELYQEVANLLPSSWRYPEICCARITTEDKEFRTANYRDAKWKLCSDIKIGGVKAGAVEVNYLEKRPELDEGPFLRDERRLIDAVTAQMGRITERKRAEEELVRLSSAVRMSTDSIVIGNLDGKIIDVNEATLKMYGTDDKRDLIGKNSFELIAPEELEKALAGAKEVLEKGYVTNREYHIITKDGGRVPVEMSVAIMKDADGKPIGSVGISRDITERKKAEEALKETNMRYKLLFESSEAGINLLDKYGNFLMVNKPASEHWGMSIENIVNKNIRDIMPPDMANEAMSLIHEIEKTGTGRKQERYLKHLDRYFIEDIQPVLDSEGKFFGVQVLTYDITERKQAEEKLTESENKFRTIFENIGDIYYRADLKGNVTLANPAAVKIMGYDSIEEVIGKNLVEDFYYYPEARKIFMEELKKHGEVKNLEVTLKRKDGTLVIVEVNSHFVHDATGKPIEIEGIAHNITERKEAEKRLQESEEKLRVMFESITDGVIVTDLTGTVVEANDGAVHLVGYSSKEELIGRNAFEFVSPKDRALAMNATKKTLEGGLVQERTEYTILTADGEEINTDSSAAVLYDSSGNPTGIINVVRDITERKKAEQELQEKNEQLKTQREELVRKATELELVSQAKSEFLASMSHELRTPLNAVIGFSELMLDGIPGEINDEQRGCVNDILDSGRRLLSLINDILDLSKVEAGKIELKLQNLDIADIITGVVQIMKPVLGKNGQEIEVSVMQGLPKVRGDKNRLEQILLNLLSNASKFTDQGGRVRIHVGRKDDYCQVAVIDTGIGIKKEDQEHVFEAFVQGETLSDRKKEGTGLGLTLTKQFVEATGGRIWMESEYGKGSAFIFTLPLAGEPLETSLGDEQSSYS